MPTLLNDLLSLFASGHDLCSFKQHSKPGVLFNDNVTLLIYRPPKSGFPLSSKKTACLRMDKDSSWFLYCEGLFPIQSRRTRQTYRQLSIMAACPVAVGEATNLRCSPNLEHVAPVTEQELRRALMDETFAPVTDPARINHYSTMLASLARARGNKYDVIQVSVRAL